MTSLTGTLALTRLALRADRRRLAIWITLLFLYQVAGAAALNSVYVSAAERQARAQLISAPTAALLAGPGYGLDDYTLGAMYQNEQVQYLLVAVVVLTVTLVVRHTRGEEASGRAELVRTNVIGPQAMLTAALVVAAMVSGLVVAATTAALTVAGFAPGPSLVLALGIGLTAFAFGCLAATLAQLTESTSAATGAALALAAASFALRALGDASRPGGSAASWVSPFAWAQQTRPFVDARWWPLALFALVVVPAVAAAFALSSRRDVGAGFLAARPGPPRAPRGLANPLGLAWRLQRASIIGWTTGIALAGTAFGAAEEALPEDSTITEMLVGDGGSLVDAFAATVVSLLAAVVGAFVVASALRASGEETGGRADAVLTTGVSRPRWLWSSVTVTAVAAVVMLVVAGHTVGVATTLSTGNPLLGPVLTGSVVYVPAVLVIAAIGVLLHGFAAGAVRAMVAIMAFAAAATVVGVILRLPQWVLNLSPFTHVPAIPGGSVTWLPLLVLTLIAVIAAGVGTAAFARRDVRDR